MRKGNDLSRPFGPPSPKGEGMKGRTTEVPLLEPEDAAAVIRTAFGQNGWQVRARNTFKVHTLVSALWVAQREIGRETTSSDRLRRPPSPKGEGTSMRDVLKWARQMRGKEH